jgi:hypothetical protein
MRTTCITPSVRPERLLSVRPNARSKSCLHKKFLKNRTTEVTKGNAAGRLRLWPIPRRYREGEREHKVTTAATRAMHGRLLRLSDEYVCFEASAARFREL